MATKTVTIATLHADYTQPIANETGLDLADYTQDADGLARLLRDASDVIGGHVAEWMDEAADDLTAIALLGDNGPKTQKLLKKIDQDLYQVEADLV